MKLGFKRLFYTFETKIMILFSFFIGIGLAASAGFRVFVPLLVMSVSAHFGMIPLEESWMWVGSFSAIIALSVASLVEVLAYYIPWVDNFLDTISVPLAGIAGTLLMAVALTDASPLLQWGLAIIAGGGAASTISASSANTRAVSSVSTAGIANPILSTVESVTSLILSILSVFYPILAFILVLLVFYFIFRVYRKFKGTKTEHKEIEIG